MLDMAHDRAHEWLEEYAPAEVKELVEQWKNDPCFDLYEVGGFGQYVDQLYAIQLEWELHHAHRQLSKFHDQRAAMRGFLGVSR